MNVYNTKSRNKFHFSLAIFAILTIGLVSSFSLDTFAEEQTVPAWIKNIAVWWGEDKISDEDFVNTFQYLIENKILEVPLPVSIEPECGLGLVLNQTSNECEIHDESEEKGIFLDAVEEHKKTVVSLIKTTTFWWGEGKIADKDFLDALQYLVQNNVITTKPENIPLIQPELKPAPENLVIWPKIDRIEDFKVQGHESVDYYQLQFKLVDTHKVSLTPDGTLSIVLMDDRNRILYLDAFSVRKAHYVDSFSAFNENNEGDKIYSWEIKTTEIKSGFTPYGKAKLAFTDKFGLKFFSEFDGLAIPQFS